MGNGDIMITMMMVVINCFVECLSDKYMEWFFPAGTITMGLIISRPPAKFELASNLTSDSIQREYAVVKNIAP